jgi:hypothetical protein
MKLPRRPFYSVDPGPDVFGLPQLTLVELACESDIDKDKRYATIDRWLAKAFRAAVWHLGEERARELFVHVSRAAGGRGRGKSFAADRDAQLLAAYDEGQGRGKALRTIARELYEATSTLPEHQRLGASATAIGTQMRKLLTERDDHRKKRAFEARRLRMALSAEPTILSGDFASKK